MSGITRKLAFLGAFVGAFVAAWYGIDSYRERATGARVAQSMEQIRKESVEKHPDVPVSEAMRQEAVGTTTGKLASEPDQRKRVATAAGNFLGFYLINTRERVEFCREQGVDIGSFVSAFEQQHTAELARARSALSMSADSEEKLYATLKPQLRQLIVQDMSDMASTNKHTLKQSCEFISENGAALATQMHISKRQPVIHRALSGNP